MTRFEHDGPGTPAAAWRSHPRAASVPTVPLETRDGARAEALVVVAAHPDDESLGAGGALAAAHQQGLPVRVVVLTDGEGSHPASPTHDAARLAARRRGEAAEAVGILAPGAGVEHLGLPDGSLAGHEAAVTADLVAILGDGRRTLVLAPWRRDGHPDHDAAGRASAVAAARTGATLWEYPVWFWHWAAPEEAPWGDFVAVPLDDEAAARKQRAVSAHRTQVEPLSDRPGDEVLLGSGVLAHFAGRREVFVRAAEGAGAADAALDAIHADGSEPWGADARWFEKRKRSVLLACLPARRHDRVLEVGCSTGVLALELAERCGELVAIDASPAALGTAAHRLRDVPHATLEQHAVPWSWPSGRFDLVVLSEVGYFLSPAALDALAGRVRGSLTEAGCVALCHWRHRVVGWPLDGPAVHERLREASLGAELACYRDRDVEVLVLGPADATPPADA